MPDLRGLFEFRRRRDTRSLPPICGSRKGTAGDGLACQPEQRSAVGLGGGIAETRAFAATKNRPVYWPSRRLLPPTKGEKAVTLPHLSRRAFVRTAAGLLGADLFRASLRAQESSLIRNPRATSGDHRAEPNWEERLTVTVGQEQGDIVGKTDKAIQAAVDMVARLGGGTVKLAGHVSVSQLRLAQLGRPPCGERGRNRFG